MVKMLDNLISHLLVLRNFLLYQPIDNPCLHARYLTLRVSAKRLTRCLKEIHVECDLVIDTMTNKSGRTTCIMRMLSEGVPPVADMQIIGHKSLGAYS